MRPIHALLVIAIFTLNTCEEKKADALQVSPAPVMSVAISDTVLLGEPITFETTCGTPTPCWRFNRFDITRNGREYNIKVFAEYDGRSCVQVVGSFKASSSVVPQERGTYAFQFWRTPEQLLHRIVVVR